MGATSAPGLVTRSFWVGIYRLGLLGSASLDLDFWVFEFGVWMSGFGCRVWNPGFGILLGFHFLVCAVWVGDLRVWISAFGLLGFEFKGLDV